ncbi:unnamed protein product [Ectocarpus sp. 13 AM-2016]
MVPTSPPPALPRVICRHTSTTKGSSPSSFSRWWTTPASSGGSSADLRSQQAMPVFGTARTSRRNRSCRRRNAAVSAATASSWETLRSRTALGC